MRTIILITVVIAVLTGCTTERVVNAGDWDTSTSTTTESAPPALPPTDPGHMANAGSYVVNDGDKPAYFFVSPSGRWHCAIWPGSMAGCQSAGPALAVAGAPATVRDDATGAEVAPTAIVIGVEGKTRFVALPEPGFTLRPGPANVLPFNRTLVAARFRCNAQEATGLSCLSEASGEGFTFSSDGVLPRYTEVPSGAP